MYITLKSIHVKIKIYYSFIIYQFTDIMEIVDIMGIVTLLPFRCIQYITSATWLWRHHPRPKGKYSYIKLRNLYFYPTHFPCRLNVVCSIKQTQSMNCSAKYLFLWKMFPAGKMMFILNFRLAGRKKEQIWNFLFYFNIPKAYNKLIKTTTK